LRKPTRSSRHLAYVNAHSLNLAYDRSDFRDALSRCDLVLNDGIGLKLAARMRGISIRENLNGSDFTFRILTVAAQERWRVFLYGGVPGVGEIVNDRLRERLPELRVVGMCDGYSPANVVAKIRATEADVVLVALGQPEQELWLDSNLQDTGALLGVGVGAFLDFVSGRVVRAPAWMNRMGIEWLFRLVHEPKRLWRRYVVGNPLFLWRAWRLRGRESPAQDGLGHKPGSPVRGWR
jgi:exopolysaccharide biosynthesis WecB/TagA/CpsF family protein